MNRADAKRQSSTHNLPAIPVNVREQADAPTPPPPKLVPRQLAHEIVPGAFTLSAREFRSFRFTVPESMLNPRVVGKFSASGGNGNDVQVLITNEDGLTNFKNGHGGPVWYDSQKVTVGNINISLSLPVNTF